MKKSLTDAMPAAAAAAAPAADNPARPSHRRGKRVIAAYFDPAVRHQLKTIGLDENRSVQALLGEALNLLFQSRGRPPIA